MANDKNLNGLSGWLILVGLLVVVSPFAHSYKFYRIYSDIFTTDTWATLTTVGSALYNPNWKPLILTEVFLNSGLVLMEAIIAILFFSRHKSFPKLYIGTLIYALLITTFDPLAAQYFLPNIKTDYKDSISSIIKSSLYIVILTPYVLRSQRVKATFVNSMSDMKLVKSEKSLHKPNSISDALLALWVSIGIVILVSVLDLAMGNMSTGEFISQLILTIIFCLFPYKISNGSNQARYIYAAFTILTYILISFALNQLSTVDLISAVITVPLDCFILYKLFQKESSAWFVMNSPIRAIEDPT